jgi:Na+(H+)/acetate symporter ActP
MLCLMNFAFSIIFPASFPLILLQIYDNFLPVFLRDGCVFCVCFSFGILVSQLSELQVDSTTL